MILSRPRSLALACGLLFAATIASAAAQDTPAAGTAPASEETAQQPASESAEAKGAEATAEPERICRYVKIDASSRRKTKVCRTVDEWRELNNIR